MRSDCNNGASSNKALLKRVSEEVVQKLSSLADGLSKGDLPPESDIAELERLSKLKAFLLLERSRRRQQLEVILFCVIALVLLGMSYWRLRSTAVDIDVRATKVLLSLEQQRSATLLPGETGQILSLRQARVSRADDVRPPEVGQDGNFDLRELARSTKAADNETRQDLTVRLQMISISEGSPYSIDVGIAYATSLRGLSIAMTGRRPITVQFGEVITVGNPPRYALRPVRATGKTLELELFPANANVPLTVFRDIHVSTIAFVDVAHSAILGGSVYVKGGADTGIKLQPSDVLTVRSDHPMLLRELTLTNGELRARLTAPSTNVVRLEGDSPRNLMPTLFAWTRYRWPTQLYATLSALIVTWLAIRRWSESAE